MQYYYLTFLKSCYKFIIGICVLLKRLEHQFKKRYGVAHDGEYDGLYASIDTLNTELYKLTPALEGQEATRFGYDAQAKGT
jgi:hypothetical protein